jgi:hypothetical protein
LSLVASLPCHLSDLDHRVRHHGHPDHRGPLRDRLAHLLGRLRENVHEGRLGAVRLVHLPDLQTLNKVGPNRFNRESHLNFAKTDSTSTRLPTSGYLNV